MLSLPANRRRTSDGVLRLYLQSKQESEISTFARHIRSASRSLLLGTLGAAFPAYAQTAHFSGVQSTVNSANAAVVPTGIAVDGNGDIFLSNNNGLYNGVIEVPWTGSGYGSYSDIWDASLAPSSPTGIAVDSSGDVYVVDFQQNDIVEIPWLGSSYGTPKTVATALSNGMTDLYGLAVDHSGNIYTMTDDEFSVLVPSGYSAAVVKIPQGCQATSCEIAYSGNGLNQPTSIGLDSSGSLFVGTQTSAGVVKVSGSSEVTVDSSLGGSTGLAIDSTGNVYVADQVNDRVVKIPPPGTTGASYGSPIVVTSTGVSVPVGVALDSSGNIYIATDGSGTVVKISTVAAVDFGMLDLGPAYTGVPPTTLLFNFDTAGTLGKVAVLTEGVLNADFTNAGTGSCTANTSYAAGASCTVNVYFGATAVGTRRGAVVSRTLAAS